MNIIFRVDASIEMGIGHVMRCLTLADALKTEGSYCHFVCREHPGNLIDQIASRGHQVYPLATAKICQQAEKTEAERTQPSHASWLGCDWLTDARQTSAHIETLNVDWLVVDHYALDYHWEKYLRPLCKKIMVIDDLADRNHECDLLLDQTFKRPDSDYKQRTPSNCNILTGAKYALLRPEFAAMRNYSLERRKEPKLKHLLISMGGADSGNATGQILRTIEGWPLPGDCHITVIMGNTAPYLDDVRARASELPWPVEVKVNISNMAQLMADSDLAIGSAGSTSWERCCLGVPTLMLILAENQREIARALGEAKAALIFDNKEPPSQLHELSTATLKRMSRAASEITDGLGTGYVTRSLEEV
jgi:UDP-2,4-diacetamido-2,4,6-trideoxy-beta-L-altropyranose hydrolase